MTENRRIVWDVFATYGWSLYALVCGLFISRWVLAAVGKSECGLYGVVGGMMVIELLAGTMRRRRGRIAAVEDGMRQTYTVKHIRKGLTLLSSGCHPPGGGRLATPRGNTLSPLGVRPSHP